MIAAALAVALLLGVSLPLDGFHRYLLLSTSVLVMANYIWVGRRGSKSTRRTALTLYLAASVGFVLFDVPQIDGVTVRDTRLVDSARRPTTISFGWRIPRAALARLALVLGKTQRSYRLTRLSYDNRLLGWPLPPVIARGRGLAQFVGVDPLRMNPKLNESGLHFESRWKNTPAVTLDSQLTAVRAAALPGLVRRVRLARLAVCLVLGCGVFFGPALAAPWRCVEPRLRRFLLHRSGPTDSGVPD